MWDLIDLSQRQALSRLSRRGVSDKRNPKVKFFRKENLPKPQIGRSLRQQ